MFQWQNQLLNPPPPQLVYCEECVQEFNDPTHLQSHVKNCHRPLGITCNVCGTFLNTTQELQEHFVNTHQTIVNNNCDQCDTQFDTTNDLYQHIVTFHDCEISRCNFCSLHTANVSILQDHIRTSHTNQVISSDPLAPQIETLNQKLTNIENFLTDVKKNLQGNEHSQTMMKNDNEAFMRQASEKLSRKLRAINSYLTNCRCICKQLLQYIFII